MYEYVGNLHAHTTYSDGAGTHAVVAAAAIRAAGFCDDKGSQRARTGRGGILPQPGRRQVLLLTGEEAHDMSRDPQRNHLLVYGARQEVAPAAQKQPPQRLLDAVNAAGGCAFLAHPIDRAVPWQGEGSYSWEDWGLPGYAGIELVETIPRSSRCWLRPSRRPGPYSISPAAWSPRPGILALWEPAAGGRPPGERVGNSDAHATPCGPVR
jgi:hypothetical protein